MSKYNLFVSENIIEEGMDPGVYDSKGKESQILVEADTVNDLTTESTWRPMSSKQVIDLAGRVSILEDNVNEFEVYESVESGTSGTVPVYEESTIRFGQYVDGQDCIVVRTDVNGRPVDRPARTASGNIILATLESDGSYTLSGTPDIYPVAIIYQVAIPAKFVGNIPLEKIVNDSFMDINDFYNGAGALSVPQYDTNESTGEITIQDVTVALYKYPDGKGKLRKFNITGEVLSVPDNEVSYVVANYNAGAPVVELTQDVSIINETTIVPLITVARFRSEFHALSWNSLGRAKIDKLHQSIVKTQRFRRQEGLSIGTTGTRNVTLSSGVVWVGAVEFSLESFDSTVDNINFVYNQNGTWQYSEVSQFNNTQYDDGTNLSNLSGNRYAVNWFYRCMEETECSIYMLLGNGNYKLAEAQGSQPPDVPYEIASHSVLVGRVIVKRGSDTPIEVQSVFDTQFSGGATRSHNDLIDRDATDSHPATAISYTGDFANTQLALDEALNNRAVDLQRDDPEGDYTLKEWWNQTQSAGRLYGGEITENSDGTVNITAGAGLVKAGSGSPDDGCACDPDGPQISANRFITWDAVDNLNLFNNAYNYIYVDGSDQQIKVTTDYYSVDFYHSFTIGRAYRTDDEVRARLCGTNLWNFNRRIQLFGEERFPIERALGMIIGDAGNRRFTCTAGVFWAELVNRFTVEAKADTDTFTYWYRDGDGGWNTLTTDQINNTGYDNNTGSITTFGGGINRWRTDWSYVVHDSTYHVVMGQEQTASLSEAESVEVPEDIPGLLRSYGSLLGRIIVQKDEDDLYISSAFAQTFTTAGVASHNDLANRDAPDAHPISSITDLQTELDSKADYSEMVGGANYDLS